MGHSEASKRPRLPGCPLRGFQPSGSYPRAIDNKRAQKGAKERKRALLRKNCKQPGLKQPGSGVLPKSTPLSTIRTRHGNSVSTQETTRTSKKTQRNSLQKGGRYGISVSTSHRRYGHQLRTPFLRTPFPRLLETSSSKNRIFFNSLLGISGDNSFCSLFFFVRFPFFTKDFKGSAQREILVIFLGGCALFFFLHGLEGQG